MSGAGSGLGGRAALVAVLLGAVSLAWALARRRAARFRPVVRPATENAALTSADVGAELGTRATFVQFSARTCASCPQVRRVLASLAATEPGVVHVDLAAEDRMDLVRRFSVFRTPTVLLLDPAGEVRSRTSGPLTPDRALAALAHLTTDATRSIDA
jgi:thiol-disulfide isomerase/thioredoxin